MKLVIFAHSHPPVAKKHEFFDSGLLYQFCINFRRRRRLSELLKKGEQDNGESAAVSAHEDSHPDSPFVLRRTKLQEDGFESGERSPPLSHFTWMMWILIIALWFLIFFTPNLYTVRPSKDLKQVAGCRGSLNSLQHHSAGFSPLGQLPSSAGRCNPKSGKYMSDIHLTCVSKCPQIDNVKILNLQCSEDITHAKSYWHLVPLS